MKLIEISVGAPREVEWRGDAVLTSIFKTPLSRRVHVGVEKVDGDQQSDLRVHGGADKAVYAHPSEHYPYWAEHLPDTHLPW